MACHRARRCEVALAGFCIVDIISRPAVLGDRKWLWVVLIVLFTLRGRSSTWHRWGPRRGGGPRATGGDTRPRAAAAAAALYAPATVPAPTARRLGPPPEAAAAGAATPAAAAPSPSPASSRSTRAPRRSTASISSCPGRCSASSAATAPERRRRCASFRASLVRPRARPTSSATMSRARPTRSARAIGFLPDVPGFYHG